ncbi:hypothetical protein TVAG_443440 [Trichomonas vaginalis G3]|uniref:receptor protein-tyrosine kinase n=1 Tax=Trichomonas vaginalis (strain ATCC PRA-98 / G3) TaxID=412133 RepID=A2F3Q6_TRIV3|nr:serine-type endopeptidase protein [Trichomonas vaginalis G3]EAY00474.1 hypothetical protein TVAG_443440 [Trichomonas vaginalis G3]KAI5494851.1 serine-type endopeptidase protein [Trichomonas vaginalis G3]|eukprot:XP_001313403.1 hypothetical protein [Trichomonas vaginalis G3]
MLIFLIWLTKSLETIYFNERSNQGYLNAGPHEFHLYGGAEGDSYLNGTHQINKGGRGTYIKLYLNVKYHDIPYEVIVGENGISHLIGPSQSGFPNGGLAGKSLEEKNVVGSGAGSTVLKINNQVVAVAAGGGGAVMNYSGSPGGGINYNYVFVNNSLQKNENRLFFSSSEFGGNGTSSECIPGSGAGGGYLGGIGGIGTCKFPYTSALSTSGSSFINTNLNAIRYSYKIVMDELHSYANEMNKMIYSNCGYMCDRCNGIRQCDLCASGYIYSPNFSDCCSVSIIDIVKLPLNHRNLNDYYTPNFNCSKKCRINSYRNNDSCRSCNEHCDFCDDSGHCLQCSEPYYRKDYQCVSQCGVGYYSEYIDDNGDYPIKICERCPQYCKTCECANSCKVCSEGYKLKEDYCVEDCGDGFYESEGVCHRCREGCLRCSDSQNCLECNSPNKLIIGNNFRICKNSKSKRKNNHSLLTLLYIITHSKNF